MEKNQHEHDINDREIDEFLAQLRRSMDAEAKTQDEGKKEKNGSAKRRSAFDLSLKEQLKKHYEYDTASEDDFSLDELEIVQDGTVNQAENGENEDNGDDDLAELMALLSEKDRERARSEMEKEPDEGGFSFSFDPVAEEEEEGIVTAQADEDDPADERAEETVSPDDETQTMPVTPEVVPEIVPETPESEKPATSKKSKATFGFSIRPVHSEPTLVKKEDEQGETVETAEPDEPTASTETIDEMEILDISRESAEAVDSSEAAPADKTQPDWADLFARMSPEQLARLEEALNEEDTEEKSADEAMQEMPQADVGEPIELQMIEESESEESEEQAEETVIGTVDFSLESGVMTTDDDENLEGGFSAEDLRVVREATASMEAQKIDPNEDKATIEEPETAKDTTVWLVTPMTAAADSQIEEAHPEADQPERKQAEECQVEPPRATENRYIVIPETDEAGQDDTLDATGGGFALAGEQESEPMIRVGRSEISTFSLEEEPEQEPVLDDEALEVLMSRMTPEQLERLRAMMAEESEATEEQVPLTEAEPETVEAEPAEIDNLDEEETESPLEISCEPAMAEQASEITASEQDDSKEDFLMQLLADPARLEAFRAHLSPEQQDELARMMAEQEEADDQPLLEPVPEQPEPETPSSVMSDPLVETPVSEEDIPELSQINDEMADEDVILMLGLGYEKELVSKLGRERVEEVKKRSRHKETPLHAAHAPAYGYDGREYRYREQTGDIRKRYQKSRRWLIARLCGTVFFALVLFLYEECGVFGGLFGGVFDAVHYPVITVMGGLQLLLLTAVFSLIPLVRGIRSLFSLEPDEHSMISLSVLIVVLCDIVTAIFAGNGISYLYNFPAALTLVFGVLCDWARLDREEKTFAVVSSDEPKYVGEAICLDTRSGKTGKSTSLTSSVQDEQGNEGKAEAKNAILARRAGFVSGYFRRTTGQSRKRQILNFILIPLGAVALVMSMITAIQGNDVATVLRAFVITMLIGMPFGYEMLQSYGMWRVSRKLFHDDCAIVGQSSVEEYDGYQNVVFDEKELFPPTLIKTKGFKFNENNLIYAVILKISILFRDLGGPVNEVLDLNSDELKRFIATGEGAELACGKLILEKVTEKGVQAKLSDGSDVLAGSAAFLNAHGVAVRQTTKDLQLLQSGDMSILYLAFDGQLSARFYVDYQPDPAFERMANLLDDDGFRVYVRTLDPGIHEDMIHHKCIEDTAAISVVRASLSDLSPSGGQDTARVNSGLVACGSQRKVTLPLRAMRHLARLFRFGTRFYSVMVGVQLLVATVLTACNIIGRMSPLYVSLYMAVCAATVFVIERFYDR